MPRLPLFFSCSFLLMVACASTPSNSEPARVVGTLRYVQDHRMLQTTLRVEGVGPTDKRTPSVLGSEMRAPTEAGAGLFTDRRQLSLPPEIDLTVPCGQAICPVSVPLRMASGDSIPASMSRTKAQRLRIGQQPLKAGESIVFFFEPVAGNEPKRLQFMGPTTSAILGLPAESLRDVPVGDYSFYLVRQGLVQDSTAALVHKIQTEYFTRSRPLTVVD